MSFTPKINITYKCKKWHKNRSTKFDIAKTKYLIYNVCSASDCIK